MSLFFIALIIIAIIRFRAYRRELKGDHDPVATVGRATDFEPCPHCGVPDVQAARGRGEIITRDGYMLVRQYFVCESCNTKSLWHRRLDQFIWTINRSGVRGNPYYSHG